MNHADTFQKQNHNSIDLLLKYSLWNKISAECLFEVRIETLGQHLWVRFTANFERHCVKSVRIRSYSSPYFPAFGLTKDTFYAVRIFAH